MIDVIELGEEDYMSLFPLVDGDEVSFHDDDCASRGEDEDCTCDPVLVRGPSAFA